MHRRTRGSISGRWLNSAGAFAALGVLLSLFPAHEALPQQGTKPATIQSCSAPPPQPPKSGEPGLGLTDVTAKLWKDQTILHVRFLDGDPVVHAQVEKFAREWCQYANVHLEFGKDPDAEIRISFKAGAGSWSVIGTDALTVKKNEPTMNFGWFDAKTTDEEFRRVTLHEFGHALGCVHEHQNPKGGIHWDRPKVYDYYRTTQKPPWSKEMVDNNLFKTYDKDSTNSTAFDPKSIMLYPIPRELTTDGFETGWNTDLSDLDKKHISSKYPFTPGALVGVHNDTEHNVSVEYRWSCDSEWEKYTFEPRDRHYWYRSPKDGSFPTFEMRYNAGPQGKGVETTVRLPGVHWKPPGYPAYEHSLKYHFDLAVGEKDKGAKHESVRVVAE